MHASEGDSRLKISAAQGNTQACTFATAINLPRVEGRAFISPFPSSASLSPQHPLTTGETRLFSRFTDFQRTQRAITRWIES